MCTPCNTLSEAYGVPGSYRYMKQFHVPETVFEIILQKDKKSEPVLFNTNYLLVLINFRHEKIFFCRHAIAFSHLHFKKILER